MALVQKFSRKDREWNSFREHYLKRSLLFLQEKIQITVKQALTDVYPNSKAEKQYNSYQLGVLFHKCVELCERKTAPTSIINQGDCWLPNFLIRDVAPEQKGSMMLDFQLARVVSPVSDLSFIIYSCTDKSFRDKYFDDALKFYHSVLISAIKSLGSNPEKLYPWNLFMKEVMCPYILLVFFFFLFKEFIANVNVNFRYKSNSSLAYLKHLTLFQQP